MPGIQIGQILIEQGVLTDNQVRHILRVQQESPRPFGDLAERLFGVQPEVIEDAWVQQYVRMAGVVDLRQQRVDEDCLRLLNRRQAWQFHMLPLNRDDNFLDIATDEEGLIRAANFSANRLDEPIRFLIARRKQLREFLMEHYPVPQYMAQFAEML